LLLDLVHRVTNVKTPNLYVSEAGSTFVFKQEAPKLLGPIDRAILTHRVPTTATLTSVDKKKNVSVRSTMLVYLKLTFRLNIAIPTLKTVMANMPIPAGLTDRVIHLLTRGKLLCRCII